MQDRSQPLGRISIEAGKPGQSAPPRSREDDLREFDETDRSIERLGERIHAQEKRIAVLKREGAECQCAERLHASMCDRLKDLVMHRALILHAMTYHE